MDKPIERYKLPRVIQEVIVLDSPLFVQEMKSAIENLSEKRTIDPDGFNHRSYHTFREKLILILYKFLPNWHTIMPELS